MGFKDIFHCHNLANFNCVLVASVRKPFNLGKFGEVLVLLLRHTLFQEVHERHSISPKPDDAQTGDNPRQPQMIMFIDHQQLIEKMVVHDLEFPSLEVCYPRPHKIGECIVG